MGKFGRDNLEPLLDHKVVGVARDEGGRHGHRGAGVDGLELLLGHSERMCVTGAGARGSGNARGGRTFDIASLDSHCV